MYDSFTFLTKAKNCLSTTVNHRSSEPLTKEMVLEQLHVTKDFMNSFPSLYYKTDKNGDTYGELIFMKLKIFHDIIRAHYNYMIMQDGRNKMAFESTEM